MEFSPFNNVVKHCIRGMDFEEKGESEEAGRVFLQAWSEATNDFEKFLAAYYVARHQINVTDKLSWYQEALQFASALNDDSVKSAYASLYINIAQCYERLNEVDKAKENYELANSFTGILPDNGPFYHGTKADMKTGNMLVAGYGSNYNPSLIMNHIYFTALLSGAGLAAALAKGDAKEHVYIVEPTGPFENDPNVTDKKFPGNLTRSYRTQAPLKIVGEIQDWIKQMPEDIRKFREKLANNKGEIIN
ncbi:NAD(+)--rifampin ADP-ribosyltransferase [Terrimonas sp.]|nr:NAD(+)--rifampin ADP-ribosyltransferase [Terrimonas sp.]PVD53836.1 NAD(+)--rifampin ADP-ribosyltransferase [Terrimonas sp.]